MVTGNGTKESPYVVSTYRELVAKASEEGAFVEFLKDINIEDEFGQEEPPTLTIASAVNINGNGCKIHGLWVRNHPLIILNSTGTKKDKSTLKNCIFESLYASGRSLIEDSTYNLSTSRVHQFEIDNCIFSGVCDSSLLRLKQGTKASGYPRGTVIKNSSMNIQLKSADNPTFAEINRVGGINSDDVELILSNSIIKLSSPGDITLYTRTDGGTSKNVRTEYWNCLFDLTATRIRLTDNSRTILSGCMFLGESSGGIDASKAEVKTVCVYNSDTFPNTEESAAFTGVSEDKLSDSEYLSNLGFPIASGNYG